MRWMVWLAALAIVSPYLVGMLIYSHIVRRRRKERE